MGPCAQHVGRAGGLAVRARQRGNGGWRCRRHTPRNRSEPTPPVDRCPLLAPRGGFGRRRRRLLGRGALLVLEVPVPSRAHLREMLDGATAPRRRPRMVATELGLVLSVFLACAVEAVEALTIVMAVGYARSWPSALGGAAAAALFLTAAVATVGSALTTVPIDTLRLAIGALLLAFGGQWLRKAILRAAGRKSLRDERAAYERERAAAAQAGAPREGL